MMSDDFHFPYMVQLLQTVAPPFLPRLCTCRATPDGKKSFLLQPTGKLDVLRAAKMLRQNDATFCLLLDLPSVPGNITAADLQSWADEAAQLSGLPISLNHPNAPFCCGDQPCCRQHLETITREHLSTLSELLGRTTSLDAAIDGAFPFQNYRHRRLLQNWAHREDPDIPGKPIRHRTLAQVFKIKERQVYKILKSFEEANPDLFAKLKYLRTTRYHRTGAYRIP
ncbi:MAG: hypothetical protein IJV69_04605 [Kiritimatiellae bacterium]|nr:hypothetical protein [Kiritimatiellia bacterium]